MAINIADNNPRIAYTATAGQTVFTIPFEFFDDVDINLYINDTLKTITTDYTLSGGDGSTGTATLTTGATVGDTIVITRDVELERTTDFPPSGPFQVNSLNTELDKIIAMIADQQDLASRGITLSDSDTSTTAELPSVTDRQGRVLAFEASSDTNPGKPIAGPLVADVTTISAVTADIATLADIEDGTNATDAISDVAAIASNVSTVAGVSDNVTTVAGQTTNMQNVTDNLSAIQNAATNATTATTKAAEAASSATDAQTAQTAAETAQTAAETAETNAETAQTAAEAAQAAAETAETNAETAETNAEAAQTAAETAETNAETAQTAAEAARDAAQTSETNAATSETNAATSASTATTKATEASDSATAAAASQVAAAASAASAATAYDSFDDRYLGVKTADPTLDNDNNALVEGALYFNSTANEMRVYDGANWIAASAAGSVSLLEYNYTATAGQTTFSGNDDSSNSLSYTVDNIIVTLNGVVMENGTDYTATDGTSVVLTDAAVVDDELNVIAFKSFTTADMVSATNGGTFQNDITINGDLTVDTDTLVVDATNNRVGIGTSSHSFPLEVADESNLIQLIPSSRQIRTEGGDSVLDSSDGDWVFEISNNEAMRIDSSGNVGIGTSSPSTDLHVYGSSPELRVQSTATNNGYIRFINTSGSMSVGMSGSAANQFLLYDRANSHAAYVYTGGASGSHTWRTNNTERMRIDSSGNVGIGTTSPQSTLHVDGDIRYFGRLLPGSADADGSATSPSIPVGYDYNTGFFRPSADTIGFTTAGTERMRIAGGSGEIGMGMGAASSVRLAVASDSAFIMVGRESTGVTDKFRIEADGDVRNTNNSYLGISDQNLKQDIAASGSQWDDIKAVQVKNYRLIKEVADDANAPTYLGVIAQELEASGMGGLVKESAKQLDDGTYSDTETEKSVKYSILYMKAVKALQEAMTKIETLETKVATLETENATQATTIADFETRIAALEAN